MHSIIPFGKAKIDSFTLLIPIDSVTIVSDYFNKTYFRVYESTGEYERNSVEDLEEKGLNKEFYNNYEKSENKELGTFLKYKKVQRAYYNGSIPTKENFKEEYFIQILISAKILGKSYFDGINKENIDLAFSYINNDGVIKIEKNYFLNSLVSDIDICKDFKLKEDSFKKLKTELFSNVIESKSKVVDGGLFVKKKLYGITYNLREKATPSMPFMKLYSKNTELQEAKNQNFVNANLLDFKDEIDYGIGRIEVTIKDYKHKKRLGLNIKTLGDLINLTNKDLDSIHSKIVGEYYTPIKRKESKMNEKLTINEMILVEYLGLRIEQNNEIAEYNILMDFSKKYEMTTKNKHDLKLKIGKGLELINEEKRSLVLKNNEDFKEISKVLESLSILSDGSSEV